MKKQPLRKKRFVKRPYQCNFSKENWYKSLVSSPTIRKYSYGVFGDTINTAARMEQNSEPMKINVSESTYEILQKNSTQIPRSVEFIAREPIEVKGKGEMMMYFVEKN